MLFLRQFGVVLFRLRPAACSAGYSLASLHGWIDALQRRTARKGGLSTWFMG